MRNSRYPLPRLAKHFGRVLVACSIVLSACGGGKEASNPTEPNVSSEKTSIVLDGADPLVYSPYDRSLFSVFFPPNRIFYLRKGNADASGQVSWRSSDPLVLQISDIGIATMTGPGTATITATNQGNTYTFPATVISTVTSISLSGITAYTYSPSSPKNQTGQIAATAKLAQQFQPTIIFDPDATNKVQWLSSNTAVATVSNVGIVSAVGVGSAVISASLPGQQASIPIAVSSQPLNLNGTYKDGTMTFTLAQSGASLSGVGTNVPQDSFRNRGTVGVTGTVLGATVTIALNNQSVLCPGPLMTITSATSTNIVGTISGPACQLSTSFSYPFNLAKQ